MHTRTLSNLGVALLLAWGIAIPSLACAEGACDAGGAHRERYPSPRMESSLDPLMTGSCCADSEADECVQIELAVAEKLMSAQLHGAASALRLAGNAEGTLEALHAAQSAWERYRDTQCALLVGHATRDIEQRTALHERCRFEFAIERILDLAGIHASIEANVQRAARLE